MVQDRMEPLLVHTFTILGLCVLALTADAPENLRELTVACTGDSECEFFIQGSLCVETQCTCIDGTVLSGDRTTCLTVPSGYGQSCQEDVQCAAALSAGGTCSEAKCACKDGYHYLLGQCWRSVPLDGSCLQNEQCLAADDFVGLQCQDGRCECRSEYYPWAGGCRHRSENGEPCAINTDCYCSGQTGTCAANKMCQCPQQLWKQTRPIVELTEELKTPLDECAPGTWDNGTLCLPEIGAPCSITNDLCKSGATNAVCIDERVCGCDNSRGRTANNRACNKVAASVNSAVCVDSSQCSPFGNNTICTTVDTKKVCNCVEGAHFDTTGLICRTSRFVHESCELDAECFTSSGGNVACQDNICTCTPNSHEADSGWDCRPDGLEVGAICQEDSDCFLPDSVCDTTKQQCQCKENYFAESKVCVKGLSSPCTEDKDCSHVNKAFCSTDNSCQCPFDYVSSANSSACLAVVENSDNCEETAQCTPSMGELKECKEGRCSCQEGTQFILEKCHFIRELGEKCAARAECVVLGGNPEAYICQNAKCTCQYGYHQNGNKCE